MGLFLKRCRNSQQAVATPWSCAAGRTCDLQYAEDWSGHDTSAFDVYNPGEGLRQIELTIGDQAFSQQQDYWNRHNAVIAIVPGANTIEIPVEGLYRGEAGARSPVIKRNLDANQIFLVVLKIRGRYKDGPLFLDNMRLVKGDVVPGAPNVSLNNVASTSTPTPAPTPAPPPVVVAAPPPPAATAPTARPSAPITAPGGDLVWESFESQSDVGRWEIRQGLPVVPEPNNVTHGSNAARSLAGICSPPTTCLETGQGIRPSNSMFLIPGKNYTSWSW